MKKKVSERTLTTKQAVTQMNHYWLDLSHLASDKVKKKSMDIGLVSKILNLIEVEILYHLTSINEDNLNNKKVKLRDLHNF